MAYTGNNTESRLLNKNIACGVIRHLWYLTYYVEMDTLHVLGFWPGTGRASIFILQEGKKLISNDNVF